LDRLVNTLVNNEIKELPHQEILRNIWQMVCRVLKNLGEKTV